MSLRTSIVLLLGTWVPLACAGTPRPKRQDPAARAYASSACDDPAFGGGAILEQRLFGSVHSLASGDAEARVAWVRQLRDMADAAARQLVREMLPTDLAGEVAAFVTSPAAASLWAAERLALVALPWLPEDFVEQAAQVCSDPDQVGVAVALRAALLPGESGAELRPERRALEIAAICVNPEHARQIREFCTSPVGTRWLAARAMALRRSQVAFADARCEAEQAGFLVDAVPSLPDLVLPRKKTEALAETPALRFHLDARGRVRCDDAVLPELGQPDALRAALRELRAGGLASGRLTLGQDARDGAVRHYVREQVLIVAAPDTPFQWVSALMQVFAEPEIAFWTLSLANIPNDEAAAPAAERAPARERLLRQP